MLTARFIAMPAIALAVIVALAQAHSRPAATQSNMTHSNMTQSDTRTVYRAVNCAMPGMSTEQACILAGNTGTSVVR
jgi:hypothetical protein